MRMSTQEQNTPPRELGYYWVKPIDADWTIVELYPDGWYISNTTEYPPDYPFEEIDEQKIVRSLNTPNQ